MKTNNSSQKEGPELIIALVGALGSNLEKLTSELTNALQVVGYSSQLIKVSSLLHEIPKYNSLPSHPVASHIKEHQKAGNNFCSELEDGAALSALSIAAIRNEREKVNSNPDLPLIRTAYIIRSLKRPEEASFLRDIYGKSFYLISGYSPRNLRVDDLASKIASSQNSMDNNAQRHIAEELINIDEKEKGNDFGQNVSDAFPLADAFFDLSNHVELNKSVTRFIEIVFGHPFHTPSRDEYVMFHSKAAALRSSDISRQVGAAISTDDGDVIAVGCNEVPKGGGGLYWAGDIPDGRDFHDSKDISSEMKRNTFGDVISRLKKNGRFTKDLQGKSDEALLDTLLKDMDGAQIMSLGEYGRTVHAEMAALLDAARRGTSIHGLNLFTTTFPCHNCAKHIVATGIKRVVYIEPYPKSLAKTLHGDSIAIEDCADNGNKIIFEPFVGIAPKRYISLFSKTKRKDINGNPIVWDRAAAIPRYLESDAHLAYRQKETNIVKTLRLKLDKIMTEKEGGG